MASIISRAGKKGITYSARVRIKGCPDAVKTFKRKSDAHKWAIKVEASMRENRDFPERSAGKRTVRDAITKYKKEGFTSKQGSEKKQKQQLKWWDEKIGHVRLSNLTPVIICDARSELLGRKTRAGVPIKNATVNRYMSALSAVITATVSTWHWHSSNPIQQIPQLPEGPGRDRFLSKKELLDLTKECQNSRNKLLLPLFLLAVATGLRKSEALRLRWTDIDLKRKTAYVSKSKNGEARTLPLEGPVWSELVKLHKATKPCETALVFPGRDPLKPMDFTTAWKNALKRAGVLDFTWHDNRHTTGSYLAMSGATIAEIAEILGHKTIEVAKRYAHHTVEHKKQKVLAMNKEHIPENLVKKAQQQTSETNS